MATLLNANLLEPIKMTGLLTWPDPWPESGTLITEFETAAGRVEIRFKDQGTVAARLYLREGGQFTSENGRWAIPGGSICRLEITYDGDGTFYLGLMPG